MQKVQAIYNYVISNIKYDNQLAVKSTADYLPEIDRTFVTKKDICYGYSALFAAMLRSVDIPTKLVMGNSDYVTTYHAWNEVYLNGSWVIIDTTVDAGWKGTTTTFEMIKNASKYKAAKQY
ncbi:Transglutaminase-like superfamily protein [compost metagenome]